MTHHSVTSNTTRHGTVLIIVAGMSALLASLALTFLARNRSDAEETQATVRDVQARIMLVAACNYIQECSRIGWDQYPLTPTTTSDPFPGGSTPLPVPVHEETFGWIDVRDGRIGPITQEGRVCWDPTPRISDGTRARPEWPAPDSIVICPMHVWKRTRFATTLHAAYNPIQARDPAQPHYLMPYLTKRDPMPAGNSSWTEHERGEQTPRVETAGKSWFRVLREGPSTFLITCGAGTTLGFRSFAEAAAQSKGDLFGNDPAYFAVLASQETRLWYRVEWSASSAEPTYHWQQHHTTGGYDSYLQWPINASHSWPTGPRSPAFDKNQAGTFRWIMRLKTEPTNW